MVVTTPGVRPQEAPWARLHVGEKRVERFSGVHVVCDDPRGPRHVSDGPELVLAADGVPSPLRLERMVQSQGGGKRGAG